METKTNRSWWFRGGSRGGAHNLKRKIDPSSGNKPTRKFFGYNEEKRGIGKEKSGNLNYKRRKIQTYFMPFQKYSKTDRYNQDH